MKKLISVITLALLICSVLVPQVFAVETGPSIPSGLSGIANAGYNIEGETANEQGKYDTNLPLGEVKTNIKPAPNPAGKKTTTVVAEKVEEDVVEESITEEEFAADFVVVLNEEPIALINSSILFADFDIEVSSIVPVSEEWTFIEEETIVNLEANEFILLVSEAALGIVTYNDSAEALEVEVPGGLYYAIYTFADYIEEYLLDYALLDSFIILNDAYYQITGETAVIPMAMLVYVDGILTETCAIVEYALVEADEE